MERLFHVSSGSVLPDYSPILALVHLFHYFVLLSGGLSKPRAQCPPSVGTEGRRGASPRRGRRPAWPAGGGDEAGAPRPAGLPCAALSEVMAAQSIARVSCAALNEA